MVTKCGPQKCWVKKRWFHLFGCSDEQNYELKKEKMGLKKIVSKKEFWSGKLLRSKEKLGGKNLKSQKNLSRN